MKKSAPNSLWNEADLNPRYATFPHANSLSEFRPRPILSKLLESVGPKSMLNTERVRANLLSPLENLSVRDWRS